ncbi:MAG: DNA mismatch repair endonuclease MutL [Flammeovirgaceae bacterium]|nr:DNA mismatch repair endonuclease MutL [Flammeovirgaceae bacterium]
MPDIIQLLPDSIANQIAAGEVVQRPASAVKELMENSVDSGATKITVVVKEAGKTHIQVIDNGSGMSETDARLSFERHATSKIRSAEDLFTIKTMGFRGEALASLAAVSQLEMKTRQAPDELGTILQIEGSEVMTQDAVVCDKGTNISIKNLFYNIPARRNFLKSNPVELKHVYDEFNRVALAHPDVAMTFIQGDETIHDLPQSKLSQRIVGLFGKNYQEQLASCNEEISGIKVTGYVGRPEAARKTRGDQFLFVNKRYIRSNYLNHAITNAFEGLLQDGTFPFYVLFIEIDPRHVDVNVHPTKTEIKFVDERAVYVVVRASVRQALATHNLSPALDFDADVNLMEKLQKQSTAANIYFDEQLTSGLKRSTLDNWEKLFEADPDSQLLKQLSPESLTTLHFESDANNESISSQPIHQPILQFQNKYLIRIVRNGIMIINQQHAHERVLYEKYLKNLSGSGGSSQQSLFPAVLDLTSSDYALITEMKKDLFSLGFQFEEFGKNSLLITGLPADSRNDDQELLEGLLEQFKHHQNELNLPIHENLARALATKACIKLGQVLQTEERSALIEGLFACSNPNYSPKGSPTFYIFDASKIEKHLGSA